MDARMRRREGEEEQEEDFNAQLDTKGITY
jgi:hypothetical protein